MSQPELTAVELARQNGVDTAIFELVNELNPGQPLQWDIEDIGAIRDEIAALLVRKGCCTLHEFYPYLELYDEDKPFLTHQEVEVWACCDDDDMLAAFHYSTDLGNCNIDNDEGDGTMFDVRDIPLAEGMTPAVKWTTTTGQHGSITSEDTSGREAHAAIIRHAIEQGWLTQDGLTIPEGDVPEGE
ncbi:MAG: hypothetical protein HS114_34580 [Anaerolineales bacterium]|nr:hypothetical protein [Anaerolineales bacterium]